MLLLCAGPTRVAGVSRGRVPRAWVPKSCSFTRVPARALRGTGPLPEHRPAQILVFSLRMSGAASSTGPSQLHARPMRPTRVPGRSRERGSQALHVNIPKSCCCCCCCARVLRGSHAGTYAGPTRVSRVDGSTRAPVPRGSYAGPMRAPELCSRCARVPRTSCDVPELCAVRGSHAGPRMPRGSHRSLQRKHSKIMLLLL